MANIVVKYNNTTIAPTPLVQRNYRFLDYGTRYGSIQEIELVGVYTGIASPVTAIQSGFALVFTGQFGTLEVFEGNSSIYRWDNVVVDDISFAQNPLFIKSVSPYSVKMRSISVPSGVIDPINEYSFSQGDDGVVACTHRIGAKGIRTSTDGLTNAIAFVKNFTGKNPFVTSLQPVFVPTGSGVLMSLTESIDRSTSSYSVQEVYKYNTGVSQRYIESWSSTISDLFDNEWLTLDVDWKIQGSPVQNNILTMSGCPGTLPTVISKLEALGFNTGNLIQNTASVTRDSGAATLQIRTSYVSGYNASDISGYFDYTVNLADDMVMPKEDWKIEGDFICFGPINYKISRLNVFKSTYKSDWRNYLSGLITSSPIYSLYHDTMYSFGGHMDLEIHENTGLGTFHATLTTTDGGHPAYLWYPKYTLEVQPNRWVFDMIPSANIEGHYVLQDLQMMSRGRVNMSVIGQARDMMNGLLSASGAISDLDSMYIQNGLVLSESYNTGLLDISYSKEWICMDKMSSGLLFTKVAGSSLHNYIRPTGFKFGY